MISTPSIGRGNTGIWWTVSGPGPDTTGGGGGGAGGANSRVPTVAALLGGTASADVVAMVEVTAMEVPAAAGAV